jgi:hypothetical protein
VVATTPTSDTAVADAQAPVDTGSPILVIAIVVAAVVVIALLALGAFLLARRRTRT